jgi:uncharacterized cupin superfamily protein
MVQTDRNAGLVANVAIKAPCRAGTTVNITLSGLQTVDGVVLVAADRVLVKNQTDQTENGLYEADSGAWTRTKDFNGAYDVVKGTMVLVTEGTINAAIFFRVSSADDPTFGTTSITFSSSFTAQVPIADDPGDDDKVLVPSGGVVSWTTFTASLISDAVAFMQTFLTSATAGAARTNLGVAIGSDVEAFDANAAKLDVDQDWTGSQRSTFVQLADAATVLVDFDTEQNMYVTVAGDRTIGQPANQTDGQTGFIIVEQDGVGGRTTSWHADWDFGAEGTPAPDTNANKKAVIAYLVDWDGVIVSSYVGSY